MNIAEKDRILTLVANSPLPRRQALARLALPRSTYYYWVRRQQDRRLEDMRGSSKIPWNKLRPDEEAIILAWARASPELSPRQVAFRITDAEGVYLSESTVYRVLRREGLVKPAEVVGFKASKEYHRKTTKPNELWATDCAHLKVIGWGWYERCAR